MTNDIYTDQNPSEKMRPIKFPGILITETDYQIPVRRRELVLINKE